METLRLTLSNGEAFHGAGQSKRFTSRSNLAAAFGLFSRWRLGKPFQVLKQCSQLPTLHTTEHWSSLQDPSCPSLGAGQPAGFLDYQHTLAWICVVWWAHALLCCYPPLHGAPLHCCADEQHPRVFVTTRCLSSR